MRGDPRAERSDPRPVGRIGGRRVAHTRHRRSRYLLLLSQRREGTLPLVSQRRVSVAGQSSIVPGTLEMLVLKTLSLAPMHGWGIGERIQQLSQDVFAVNQGTLYPALERLQRDGLISAEWRVTENNRR